MTRKSPIPAYFILILTQIFCTSCTDENHNFPSTTSHSGYLLEDNNKGSRQDDESNDSGSLNQLNYDVFKEHYGNGNIKREINFSNGKLHGGYITWFQNGQKQMEINYRFGLRNGPTREWYQTGQLKEKSNYIGGNADGTYEAWHENGNKSFEASYSNGTLNGRLNRWTENQKLISEQYFKEGLLVLD